MAIHLSRSTGIRINSRRRESRNPRGMFARGRARGGNVGMPDVSLRSRAPFLAATVTYRDCCAGIPANVVPLPLLASKKFQANKDYPRIALTSVSRRINYPPSDQSSDSDKYFRENAMELWIHGIIYMYLFVKKKFDIDVTAS